MLMQPLRNLAPLALLDPEIPGRTEPPLASGEWGINLAAAKGNFPEGLKVHIPAWTNMSRGDTVRLLLNGSVVDQHTLAEDTEVGERVTLWIAHGRLHTGSYTLSYDVKRLSQALEPYLQRLKLCVKLERPGGQDLDPDAGEHSELYLHTDPAIIADGVDKDTAKDGVDIIIQAKPGSPTTQPYPNIAVGDKIIVSWGGKLVLSDPVTQAQIDDPDNHPIVVHISEAVILSAGDSGPEGLAVTFMIHDLVNNASEDWCLETRIVVDTGNSRQDAPILEQADGNVLDLDMLGDAAMKLLVWAASVDFKLHDVIIMHIKGTTLDDKPIDIEVRQSIDKTPPLVVEVLLPNSAARALAKTQAVFFFELERAGVVIQRSKGRFINIIGEARRLAAPIAEDAQNGALDPDLPSIRVRIPFDEIFQVGMAIELKWFGRRADLSTYEPELDWYFPSQGEIDDKEDFFITVEGRHLKTLEGGTLELSYNLLSEENGEIVKRGSLSAALLNVGEAKFELVKPIVLGEKDGALEPKDLPNGTGKLTAPRPTVNPTQSGDVVTYTWLGEVSGKQEDSITLNALSKDKDVVFTLNLMFVAAHIEPNRGRKVTVKYSIWRFATGETSYSNPLEFTVGEVFDLEPAPPRIQQAEADGTTLLPIKAVDALTALIPADGWLPTDKLSVTWSGASGTAAGGSHTTDPKPISETGLSIALLVSVLAFNLGRAVTVTYTITRDGKSITSQPLILNVGTLPASALNSPLIQEADANNVLDVAALGGKNVTIRALSWALIAVGQQVWMTLEGQKADGSAHNLTVWAGGSAHYVNDTWFSQGYWLRSVANSHFTALGDDSRLRIKFWVALDQSNKVENAVAFVDRVYTIRAFEVVTPTITRAEDSKGAEIPPAGFTVDTTVTLTGTASKGQKVQVLDGDTIKGEATADLISGIWTLVMTALSLAAHSFTAKALYGAGASSAARVVHVVAATDPTITSVKDASNWDIPDMGYTVHNRVTVTGSAPRGHKVEVFVGTVSMGKVEAGSNSLWTITLNGLALNVQHSIQAMGQYASKPPSNVWRLTSVQGQVPDITAMDDSKGGAIANGGTTYDTSVRLRGTANAFLAVEIFNGSISKGKSRVDASGNWTLTVTALPLATHEFTAKAWYGSSTVSTAWKVTVAPLIIVDPSRLTLSGANLFTRSTAFVLSGFDPVGTAAERRGTGGTPPYTYSSSNSAIATVDSTGMVRSQGNGSAAITVRDSQGRTGTFEVVCSGVEEMVLDPRILTAGVTAYIQSQGGRTFPRDPEPRMAKYRRTAPDSRYMYLIGYELTGNTWHPCEAYQQTSSGRWHTKTTNREYSSFHVGTIYLR